MFCLWLRAAPAAEIFAAVGDTQEVQPIIHVQRPPPTAGFQASSGVYSMTTYGKFAIALLAATALASVTADARSLKWARSGDSLTLDPHAQNEGPTHNLSHHIYEPLIHRDSAGKEVAALAVSWKVTDDANVWEF